MAECEFIDSCPFFQGKLAEKAVEVEELKEKYCRTNNLHCARYMVATAVGKDKVPPDLYPNETDVAYKIIAEEG